MERAIAREGLTLVLAATDDESRLESKVVIAMLERRIRALLLVPIADDHSYLEGERQFGTPIVAVDRPLSNAVSDSVVFDNRAGARAGVLALLDAGHRRVAFVGSSESLYTHRERVLGYRDALEARDLPIDPTLICTDGPDTGSAANATRRSWQRTRRLCASCLSWLNLGRRAARTARVHYRPPMIWLRMRHAAVAAASLAVGVALAGPAVAPAAAAPRTVTAEDSDTTVIVMARNLYLGADVGVALNLLPDMPAAAQFMWEQVAATDFDARVGLLAQEAATARPDVIGLQEATIWSCRPKPWSAPVPVFDFTEQFLAATGAAGVQYVVAEHDGARAENPGYSIPAMPFLTTVRDPATFQPLFGTDTAACGFVIGDALLVRADLADHVLAVGTGEYEDRYAVAPVVFTIDRGYAWADLAIAGTTVRAVTTHLESLWDPDSDVPAAQQARQLVADLASTTVPTIVVGDFNSDPRDPRVASAANPGGQPKASAFCPAQPDPVSPDTADATCSAYWTMVDAGFLDSGPDALEPANRTWGAEADLAGPNPDRLRVSLAQGNDAGFTDRLDYVFVRHGATPVRAEVFGNAWPDSDDVWPCDAPGQVRTTEESSAILAQRGLAEPVTGRGICLPSDHAGVLAVVDVSGGPEGTVAQPAPPDHSSLRIGLLTWLLIILGLLVLVLVLVVWGVYHLATRGRRRHTYAGGSPIQ